MQVTKSKHHLLWLSGPGPINTFSTENVSTQPSTVPMFQKNKTEHNYGHPTGVFFMGMADQW